jgi:hypothetical protein
MSLIHDNLFKFEKFIICKYQLFNQFLFFFRFIINKYNWFLHLKHNLSISNNQSSKILNQFYFELSKFI